MAGVHPMKRLRKFDRPFRIAFTILVGMSLILLVWQCSQRPPGPARIDLHVDSPAGPAKPLPAP